MKVELIPTPSVITDESLKQYLAGCASVVRNAQPKNPDRLFNRLLKESFGGKPSRMFEYIPCKVQHKLNSRNVFELTTQFFGFFEVDSNFSPTFYYSNARELLNWGLTWEEIIPLVDFTHYRAVKVTAPYFLYGQASTHNQITSVSHSNRYTESGLGYWKPEEVKLDRIDWDLLVLRASPRDLQDLLRRHGINRREVYARGSDMLAYRVFTLGGYTNNPNAWPHFINQRLHDAHTQKEMRDLAGLITEYIK